MANIFTLRRGGINEPALEVDGSTEGWGLGLRLGKVAGFRYDRGTGPQSAGLQDADRKGIVAFVDIVALTQTIRGPRSP